MDQHPVSAPRGARATATVPRSPATATWILPTALLLLSLVPILAGALRLVSLSGAAELVPADPRFSPQPLPLVLHIGSATVFALLGAFQFSAGLRRSRPRWHRAAGRVLVLAGLTVALSALWLNQFSWRPAGSGDLLYVFRLLFGSAMLVSIVLAYRAIRRRDIPRHRAWMIRAYAIGLAAGTQVFTQGFGEAVFGSSELNHALLAGAGWVINLTVAELAIRRRTRRPASPRPAAIAAVR